MTDNGTIWKTIREHLPKKTWIPIREIFGAVERNIPLDNEDLDTSKSRNNNPRWQTNVRRLLRSNKGSGRVRARPHDPCS